MLDHIIVVQSLSVLKRSLGLGLGNAEHSSTLNQSTALTTHFSNTSTHPNGFADSKYKMMREATEETFSGSLAEINNGAS